MNLVPQESLACKWSAHFENVIGYGKVAEMLCAQEKAYALNQMMSHYSEKKWHYDPSALRNTRVWCVKIESVTGYATYFPYHAKKKLEKIRMEFLPQLQNGTVVTTTNDSDAECFGELRNFPCYVILGKDDPKGLLEIHNTLMTINHHDRSVPLTAEADSKDMFRILYARRLDGYVREGVLFFDDETNAYRPTLRGAFSMVWQELFSGNYFRRKKMEEKYSDILEDMDSYEKSLN